MTAVGGAIWPRNHALNGGCPQYRACNRQWTKRHAGGGGPGAGVAAMPDSVPARVREELAALPGPKREAFHEAYRQQARSAPTAYALCLLVGGQYGYVGRWGLQILFWVTLGGLMVWWIVDLFRIPGMVRRYNERVAHEILGALRTRPG